MARNLREKKMPAKPMKEMEADEELALDMPMSDEEAGDMEAEEDMLSMDEESIEAGPLDDASDDELIEEMKKRGLSMDMAEEPADEEIVEESEEEIA